MNVGMELVEGVRIAAGAIRANTLRASLATLGIVIGILTVTLMGTAIAGLNQAFLKSISSLGGDVLHVSKFSWFIDSNAEWLKAQNRQEITLAQVSALEQQMKTARAVAPYTEVGAGIRYRERSSQRVWVIGTTEQFLHTAGVNLARGRFLSASESAGARPVIVLGSQVASNLFLREPGLGRTVQLGGYNFEVVGVAEPQGNFLGQFSLDNQVFIPVKQMYACFNSRPYFSIQVKARSLEQLDETKEEIGRAHV